MIRFCPTCHANRPTQTAGGCGLAFAAAFVSLFSCGLGLIPMVALMLRAASHPRCQTCGSTTMIGPLDVQP